MHIKLSFFAVSRAVKTACIEQDVSFNVFHSAYQDGKKG